MKALWILITQWPLNVLVALILERDSRKTKEPGEKPLKHRRNQLQELSHMKRHTPDLVSVVRGTTPGCLPYPCCPIKFRSFYLAVRALCPGTAKVSLFNKATPKEKLW